VDLESLLADLTEAVREDAPQLAVRDVLQRALEHRSDLADALPCTKAELVPLLTTPELTVIKTVWAPGMTVPPHDHQMWGAIAVYTGKEQNTFWRRAGAGIEESGGRELSSGDVGLMGVETIHSVHAPLAREWTGAIHVYGGDFMAQPRSMWIDGEELPNDGPTTAAIFERANRDLEAQL
jgi:predicted metal-dependent enzyme (double-stranded beta helix superfamily)